MLTYRMILLAAESGTGSSGSEMFYEHLHEVWEAVSLMPWFLEIHG